MLRNGQVRLERLSPPPSLFERLFLDEDDESVHFRKFSRAYNSCLAFASQQMNDVSVPGGSLVVHGQLYTKIRVGRPLSGHESVSNQVRFVESG